MQTTKRDPNRSSEITLVESCLCDCDHRGPIGLVVQAVQEVREAPPLKHFL